MANSMIGYFFHWRYCQ